MWIGGIDEGNYIDDRNLGCSGAEGNEEGVNDRNICTKLTDWKIM